MSTLLKSCRAGLQQELDFFEVNSQICLATAHGTTCYVDQDWQYHDGYYGVATRCTEETPGSA
jgi:hypothetical protein